MASTTIEITEEGLTGAIASLGMLTSFSPDDRDLGLARRILPTGDRLHIDVSVPMIGIWVWRVGMSLRVAICYLCFSPDDRDLGLARIPDSLAYTTAIVSVPMIGIWVWRVPPSPVWSRVPVSRQVSVPMIGIWVWRAITECCQQFISN